MCSRAVLLLVAVLVLSLESCECRRPRRARFPPVQRTSEPGSSSLCTPTTMWIQQPVDHFDYENPYTFKQRYLLCDQYWDGSGPMFFYTGNEGDITMFYENTGFMFDIAPSFNALIVFAEHRYYGQSIPFGALGFTREHIGFLSVEQVLADFATLIESVKAINKTPTQPVVSFGGSYGGMLTAWFRLKYPGVVVGGIAASAPVLQFPAFVNPELYYNISSQDFANAAPGCAEYIRTSFQQMITLGQSASGRAQLTEAFNLCAPLEGDATELLYFTNEAYQYTAMVDYPYPNSFLQPVPAWPVNAMCDVIVPPSQPNFLQSIAAAVGIYYNYTGNQPCFNLSQSPSGSLGLEAWDYQSCTEMVLAEGNNGIQDMYLPPDPWTLAGLTAGCIGEWGVKPNENFIPMWQGGATLSGGSNIVFSNGNLDPWSGGGVLQNLSDTLVAIIIENGAHHLDLRSANPNDIPSVIQARLQEVQWIKTWLAEAATALNF